jgi:hypothetical protein
LQTELPYIHFWRHLVVKMFPMTRYNWNIVECGIKHHKPNLQGMIQTCRHFLKKKFRYINKRQLEKVGLLLGKYHRVFLLVPCLFLYNFESLLFSSYLARFTTDFCTLKSKLSVHHDMICKYHIHCVYLTLIHLYVGTSFQTGILRIYHRICL